LRYIVLIISILAALFSYVTIWNLNLVYFGIFIAYYLFIIGLIYGVKHVKNIIVKRLIYLIIGICIISIFIIPLILYPHTKINLLIQNPAYIGVVTAYISYMILYYKK